MFPEKIKDEIFVILVIIQDVPVMGVCLHETGASREETGDDDKNNNNML